VPKMHKDYVQWVLPCQCASSCSCSRLTGVGGRFKGMSVAQVVVNWPLNFGPDA
jgi:hypothetical protein